MRIEALRLIAIVVIAIFHTFQPLFSQAIVWIAADEGTALGAAAAGDIGAIFAASPLASGALGFINLLGAYGNCVFFMISGLFLIPAAARASTAGGFWRDQARRTARRAAVILASVAFYAAIALAFSLLVLPMPGISPHESAWLTSGLEFIWVYLALVVATPAIAWLWERCPARIAVVAVLAVAVYGVNAYIAFVSPGEAERGLFEWRKLMSAASYGIAYLIGGALAARIGKESARSGRKPSGRAVALGAAIVASCLLEIHWALAGDARLMVASSYKSTSAISLVLALCSVLCAMRTLGADPGDADASPHRAAIRRLIVAGAAGILGFYIMQTMFYTLWRVGIDSMLAAAVRALLATTDPAAIAGIVLIAGCTASIAVVAAFLCIDRLLRAPVLKALRLQG